MTVEQLQRTATNLAIVARSHKRQASWHRRQARERMEQLRLLREKMKALGIGLKVVEK